MYWSTSRLSQRDAWDDVDTRHLKHRIEKDRNYFSAFLSGFKTSYSVPSHEHCRNGAVFLKAMRKMTTIKAFRLFFLIHRFSFLSPPGLRKQIRIAQAGQNNVKGDCKIFEMAVVCGKDNTLSETNHNYYQVWDRIFSFMTWSIDVNCLFVFFGTKRFLGVF